MLETSRGLCRSGSWCDVWEDGRHLRGAQGGSRRGVSQRGLGGSRASCFIAFLQRCARRLRARPQQSCGSAEHPGLKRRLQVPRQPCRCRGCGTLRGAPRGQLRKKKDMPVSSSELCAGHQPKIGWCLSPVPRPKKSRKIRFSAMIRLSTICSKERRSPGWGWNIRFGERSVSDHDIFLL